MNRTFLLAATFLSGLAAAAAAQTGAPAQNLLTNHDIVVLGQAGFNENFIIDLISMSRTRFDTSVTGLAELAKEGVAERLIRVMLTAPATPQPGSFPSMGAATTAIMSAAMMAPPMEMNRPKRAPKQNESAMAIASQAPFYKTQTMFWGLWKKKTGVGAGLRTDQPVGGQLGTAYGQVQWMSPTGVPARYVTLP